MNKIQNMTTKLKINKKSKSQQIPNALLQRDILIKKFNQKHKQKYINIMQKIVQQERMKQIISDNVNYFRNIIEIKQNCKPNQLSLKFTSRFPKTLYSSDFAKKIKLKSHNFSPDLMIQNIKILDNTKKIPFSTIYQNQFKKVKENLSKQSKQIKQNHLQYPKSFKKKKIQPQYYKNQAPGFLNTHNNIQFKNWGISKNLPNMKPFQQVAASSIQFKASTVYNHDFFSHTLPKTQMIVFSDNSSKKSNIWTGDSSYRKDFSQKKNRRCQIEFKPIQKCGATMLKFTNSTQYKMEYEQQNKKKKEERKIRCKNINRLLTNNQIQNLVMQI